MARKKIFAVYEGDTYMGDYTAVEAAPLLGIACATVSAYANSGARLRGRYRIEVVGNTEIDTEMFIKDFIRETER